MNSKPLRPKPKTPNPKLQTLNPKRGFDIVNHGKTKSPRCSSGVRAGNYRPPPANVSGLGAQGLWVEDLGQNVGT